ncbi:MAG: 5'-nucleotidase C-terminal domain-containing protein [Ignavibacteriales bacterium]|nr:5'-nucleotidase C-terminal domain-containing protein [Ignavibacteriales bacterium]
MVRIYSQQCGFAARFFEEEGLNLTKQGVHDTPIGNLVTDAFKWKTGTQIAIEAGGSTAMALYQGPIVPADLFRVTGYGFNIS